MDSVKARHGMDRYEKARRGLAVEVRQGMDRRGWAWQSWYGAARIGVVRSCGLRYGKPRFGSQAVDR